MTSAARIEPLKVVKGFQVDVATYNNYYICIFVHRYICDAFQSFVIRHRLLTSQRKPGIMNYRNENMKSALKRILSHSKTGGFLQKRLNTGSDRRPLNACVIGKRVRSHWRVGVRKRQTITSKRYSVGARLSGRTKDGLYVLLCRYIRSQATHKYVSRSAASYIGRADL